MRININSQLFEKGDFVDLLSKGVDIECLREFDWFLNNEKSYGFVKDIRLKGMCFLMYKLSALKNNTTLVSYDVPLFKFHFEFESDITYCFDKGIKKSTTIKKGRFELFHITQEGLQIHNNKESKNYVEIFLDKNYLKGVIGDEYKQLTYVLDKLSKKEILINYGIVITEEIINIINAINDCEYTDIRRDVFLELKIKELIITAIAVFEDNYSQEEEEYCEKRAIKEVEKYIKLHLNKELSISNLSLIAGMNTTKFKKYFKGVYGITVFKYITALRIEKAKDLIKLKSYTISQASYEVGYKNAQHFTVAFKKNMGYLPSELKK